MKFPRSCVFVGTTNAEEYLRDETGARRFWPVRCGRIDLERLRADRDQLWAEARVRFERGERWWITDPEVLKAAEEEQQDRAVRDPWHDQVIRLARMDCAEIENGKPKGSTTITALLSALNVLTERQDQASKNRVARILRSEGWERFHTGPRTARQYKYRPGGPVDNL
jgi:predicted P-loop ATPase